MPNRYYTSTGERVTEATIKARYTIAIRNKYQEMSVHRCHGCGGAPNGSAHIIPKAILKQMHMTELIWNPRIFFPACNKCNMICENVSSEEITTLHNYEYIKEVMWEFAPERAKRLPV